MVNFELTRLKIYLFSPELQLCTNGSVVFAGATPDIAFRSNDIGGRTGTRLQEVLAANTNSSRSARKYVGMRPLPLISINPRGLK